VLETFMDGDQIDGAAGFRAHALVHLGDIVDCGLDAGLDAIQGLGFDGVTVEVTSPPFARLRAIAVEPRFIRSDGGYFYPAEPGLYEDTRIKPLAADWLKQRKDRSYLPAVADACAARGLALRLRISAFGAGRLAAKHPDAAGKTVFGDLSSTTLCPADPDVRALVRATVRELVEGYEPEALEVADLRYWSGVEAGHSMTVQGGSMVDDLFELCFCESSRQAAQESEVDVAAAARRVQVEIERLLDDHSRGDGPWEDFLEDNEPVADYVASQVDLLEGFARSLVDAYPGQVVLVKPAIFATGVTVDAVEGPQIVMVFPSDWPSTAEFVEEMRDWDGMNEDSWLEFDAAEWAVGRPQDFVRLLKSLAEVKVRRLVLGGWPMIGAAGRDALQQALRYARRAGK
jgi:hypothetical protein